MLPREIQAEHWPDRNIYNLPRRPLGGLRYAGLIPLGFGVFFAWMPASQMIRFIRRAAEGEAGGAEWFFVAFLSLFVLAALIPIGLGMFILLGRTRLIAEGGNLKIVDIAGLFRRSRKIAFSDIQGLEVVGTGKQQHTPGATWARLGALSATLKSGRKRPVLIGYPHEWLTPLAEELSGLMRLKGTTAPVTQVESPKAEESAPTDEVVAKPPESQVVFSARTNGIELTVPPAGIKKGIRATLVFGLLWLLVVGSIGAGILLAEHGRSVPLPVLLFVAVFWLIGAAMIASSLHMGRRCLKISADRFSMRVDQQGPFGKRSWQWQRSELTAIRSDKSGTEINNVPLYELQVHANNRKKVGLMGGRPENELRWLAFELRKVLGVPPSNQQSPTLDSSRQWR